MIEVNGKTYASVDDMPPDVRQTYEKMMKLLADQDHDGVPDLVQKAGQSQVSVEVSRTFTVDGQTYHSLEEMPPEVRQKYEDIMARFAQKLGPAAAALQDADAPETAAAANAPVGQVEGSVTVIQKAPPTVMQEERPGLALVLALAAGLLLVLLVAGAALLWAIR